MSSTNTHQHLQYEQLPVSYQRCVEGVDEESDDDYVPIDGPQGTHGHSPSAGSMQRVLTQLSVLPERPDSGERSSNYYTSKIFVSTKWIVLPLFFILGLGAAVLIALNFTNVIETPLGFAILLLATIVVGGMGSLFVWRFGTVQDVITFMELQNKWYDVTLQSLSDKRMALGDETRKVAFEVEKVKNESKELNAQYEQFEELRKSLAGITKENEQVLELVETVNSICDETRMIIKQNQRAQLLSIYYDLVSTDGAEGGETGEQRLAMTERDYKRKFLGRLDLEMRDRLESLGGFSRVDRDGDGTIDKDEMLGMINEILDTTQDDEERHLETLRQLNYS